MKTMKRILSAACAALMLLSLALSLTACSDSPSGVTEITYMYNASIAGMQGIKDLLDEFNNTVGAEKGIRVKGVPKTAALSNLLNSLLPTKATPDIVRLDDRYFKSFTYLCEDLTDYIDAEAMDDFYPGIKDRYRFNKDTLTSNHTDPLYGVPAVSDITVLYYNETALQKNGIICISVAEEDLDAFNAGTLKDNNGKTKADYGLTVDIPAKGFFRSENPYVPNEGEVDGTSWSQPSDSEVLVFNNRIAMSWDETDDVAMICTKTWNSDSVTQYGFYTEWWFNYVWSVGGDCIEDLNGGGDWNYTLPCDLYNYIVNEGMTYTGVYTGKTYQAGETLEIQDILNVDKGATITLNTDNDTDYYFSVNGSRVDGRNLEAEVADGTLSQLPSNQTAFKRFYSLAGTGGKEVCPYPSAFGSVTSDQYFASGKLAFLIELLGNTKDIDKVLDDDFKYAPLPIYKTYSDPKDPFCDTVATQGKSAVHSYGQAFMVSAKSTHKEEAAVFLNWMITEGMRFQTANGANAIRMSDEEVMMQTLDTYNPSVILESMPIAQAGDWWYLPDSLWIDNWANPLNNEVRNGIIGWDEFIYAYTDKTNEDLDAIVRGD